jgi:hypothetical protein
MPKAQKLKAMSEEEFYERNRKSQEDIKRNRLYTQEEIKKRFGITKRT